jgi:hypothetical protein
VKQGLGVFHFFDSLPLKQQQLVHANAKQLRVSAYLEPGVDTYLRTQQAGPNSSASYVHVFARHVLRIPAELLTTLTDIRDDFIRPRVLPFTSFPIHYSLTPSHSTLCSW